MEIYSFEFPPENEIFKFIFLLNLIIIDGKQHVLRVEFKKQIWKISRIFQPYIFRIKSNKTPTGLRGEGGKSNLSDGGP